MNINEAKEEFCKYNHSDFTIYREMDGRWFIQYGKDSSDNDCFIEVDYETKYYESLNAALSDIRKIVKSGEDWMEAEVYIDRDSICIKHTELMSRKKFSDDIVD